MRVRRADPSEAADLTDLALRSKAYWDYDAAFIEACREELTVHTEDVERLRTTVAEDTATDRVLGFCALGGDSDEDAELWFMFVEPDAMGQGIARALYEDATRTARTLGLRRFRIESDPNASGFCEAMGAVRVGMTSSKSINCRLLPVYLMKLDG